MEKTKIGIFGLGHLGKIHLKCLRETPFEIVGYYDPNPGLEFSEELGITRFSTVQELIKAVDAVDIVSTTTSHYDLILEAIKHDKHVFVEKPICYDLEQVADIKSKLREDVVLQVGHVERFNPAYIPLKGKRIEPMFIEGHRIANFNPRGTDVSVVLDLMIHDLDIVCALVNSDIANVSASGVSIVSDTPDIANARIEFENGCVANLTASRISTKQMRKLRLFANDSYVSIDFLTKELNIISIEDDDGDEDIPAGFELDTPKGKKYVQMESPEIINNNAIQDELNAFYRSINEGTKVEAGIHEAHKSLEIALEIMRQIQTKEQKYHQNKK